MSEDEPPILEYASPSHGKWSWQVFWRSILIGGFVLGLGLLAYRLQPRWYTVGGFLEWTPTKRALPLSDTSQMRIAARDEVAAIGSLEFIRSALAQTAPAQQSIARSLVAK